jgi:hypothetical protein
MTAVPTLTFQRYHRALRDRTPLRFQGRVAQVIGLSIEVEGLRLAVGDVCTILPEMAGRRPVHGSDAEMSERRAGGISAEVVGFRATRSPTSRRTPSPASRSARRSARASAPSTRC